MTMLEYLTQRSRKVAEMLLLICILGRGGREVEASVEVAIGEWLEVEVFGILGSSEDGGEKGCGKGE